MAVAKKKTVGGVNKLIAEKREESANIPKLPKKAIKELRAVCSFNDLQNAHSKRVSAQRVCRWLADDYDVTCGRNMLHNICAHYLQRESFSRAGSLFKATQLSDLNLG